MKEAKVTRWCVPMVNEAASYSWEGTPHKVHGLQIQHQGRTSISCDFFSSMFIYRY